MSEVHTDRVGVSAIVQAALDAGHEPSVQHSGKRFRLRCSCGWSSPSNWTRKRTFEAVQEHVYAAGHRALGQVDQVDAPMASEVQTQSGGRC
jgi:hypothetical protein